ncbi:MAG: multifunctional tRNA nucleotidyl transferase/2'3'-cyclic phosphodiesterase/2'nucleotidase/phosphatase [Firmicutes bacterium ADurb.Bin248]|nr:MAG: multifunctional tRNA nucleotidyl transferase/2'3'-cyclic phosphodiesterase/2'nucleotidase/phosphatase [Firmicutes bacterium ADurb.Bin248]HOG02227.1 HDIG domain-containing protein [Clostridia bacterium]HPK17034.1 HDIG domain-containing protein [Clostridia bacterium]
MTPLELYSDIGVHLLQDGSPSAYLSGIRSHPLFRNHPFCMLHRLRETEQSPEHHPEGNVWLHTLLVVDEAAKLRARSADPAAFMWAALLHDIGKPATTKLRKGRITAYDHDKVGARLAREFLGVFTDDGGFIDKVSGLIRYHMQILFVLKDLPFADIGGMLRDTDIGEVALLGLCDRLGRAGCDRAKEEERVRLFLQKCKPN